VTDAVDHDCLEGQQARGDFKAIKLKVPTTGQFHRVVIHFANGAIRRSTCATPSRPVARAGSTSTAPIASSSRSSFDTTVVSVRGKPARVRVLASTVRDARSCARHVGWFRDVRELG
jgi:hypothetical protein